jgi:hypothetical protein
MALPQPVVADAEVLGRPGRSSGSGMSPTCSAVRGSLPRAGTPSTAARGDHFFDADLVVAVVAR